MLLHWEVPLARGVMVKQAHLSLPAREETKYSSFWSRSAGTRCGVKPCGYGPEIAGKANLGDNAA